MTAKLSYLSTTRSSALERFIITHIKGFLLKSPWRREEKACLHCWVNSGFVSRIHLHWTNKPMMWQDEGPGEEWQEIWTKHVEDGRLLWLFTPQSQHKRTQFTVCFYSHYTTEARALPHLYVMNIKNILVFHANMSGYGRGSEHRFQSIPWNSQSPALTYNRRHV